MMTPTEKLKEKIEEILIDNSEATEDTANTYPILKCPNEVLHEIDRIIGEAVIELLAKYSLNCTIVDDTASEYENLIKLENGLLYYYRYSMPPTVISMHQDFVEFLALGCMQDLVLLEYLSNKYLSKLNFTSKPVKGTVMIKPLEDIYVEDFPDLVEKYLDLAIKMQEKYPEVSWQDIVNLAEVFYDRQVYLLIDKKIYNKDTADLVTDKETENKIKAKLSLSNIIR